MKTDLYTKTVLTIIAICLTIIVLKHVDIIPNAIAASSPSIVKTNSNYGLIPLNSGGTIDVRIISSPILDVNIKSTDYKALRHAGPLEIEK